MGDEKQLEEDKEIKDEELEEISGGTGPRAMGTHGGHEAKPDEIMGPW
jgi:hypothetical protein